MEWRKRRSSMKKRDSERKREGASPLRLLLIGSSGERGRGFTLTNSSRRELLLGAKRLGWR